MCVSPLPGAENLHCTLLGLALLAHGDVLRKTHLLVASQTNYSLNLLLLGFWVVVQVQYTSDSQVYVHHCSHLGQGTAYIVP